MLCRIYSTIRASKGDACLFRLTLVDKSRQMNGGVAPSSCWRVLCWIWFPYHTGQLILFPNRFDSAWWIQQSVHLTWCAPLLASLRIPKGEKERDELKCKYMECFLECNKSSDSPLNTFLILISFQLFLIYCDHIFEAPKLKSHKM